MKICLYGAAREQIADEYLMRAEQFGRSLAMRGYTMVFGGGAQGMMGAAARGVQSCGGRLLGIAPADGSIDGKLFSPLTEFLPVSSLAERKRKFIALSDAFVVMPGGIGTYDEFFDLLSVKRVDDGAAVSVNAAVPAGAAADTLTAPSRRPLSRKPVAVYNINGYYDLLEQLMEQSIRQGFAAEWTRDLYRFCRTEAELWRCLEDFPEECCDGAEISDHAYADWETGTEKGFWNAYLAQKKDC